MKIKVEGNSELLVKDDAWVRFGIICAKCYRSLTIVSILHFADYPQVSVEPCSCPSLTKGHEAITIVQEIVVDTEHLVGKND